MVPASSRCPSSAALGTTSRCRRARSTLGVLRSRPPHPLPQQGGEVPAASPPAPGRLRHAPAGRPQVPATLVSPPLRYVWSSPVLHSPLLRNPHAFAASARATVRPHATLPPIGTPGGLLAPPEHPARACVHPPHPSTARPAPSVARPAAHLVVSPDAPQPARRSASPAGPWVSRRPRSRPVPRTWVPPRRGLCHAPPSGAPAWRTHRPGSARAWSLAVAWLASTSGRSAVRRPAGPSSYLVARRVHGCRCGVLRVHSRQAVWP